MNEDFLHRIRVQPRPQFLARLKAKLDRQPLYSRARLVRSLAAGLLVGASALALASLALRGEFAGLHWSGWGGAEVGSQDTGTGAEASSAPGQRPQIPDSWARNAWVTAGQGTSRKSHKTEASGGAAIVPLPQSGATAPSATTAQYSQGAALISSEYAELLRVTVTRETDSLSRRVVQQFVQAGYQRPEVLVQTPAALFAALCSGSSADFSVAARRITATEAEVCARAGSAHPVEVRLGSEALVLVRSKLYGPLPLSARDLYVALSKTAPDPANPGAVTANRRRAWNEVNPALPPDDIKVFGPVLSSGLGQSFLALIMEAGCDTFASFAELPSLAAHDAACRTVREDGVYVDANPQGYPLFVQKLLTYPTAVGILDYTTFRRTGDALVASPLGDVQPTPQSIDDGSYPGARTFYLYVNKDHFHRRFSMRKLLLGYLGAADGAGYLGLAPAPREERDQIRDALAALDQQP